MLKINKSCTCGAKWKGIVPADVGKGLILEWENIHTGKGHNPCNAKTASRARAQNLRNQKRNE